MSTIAISYGVGGPRLPDRIAKLRLLTLAPVLGSGRETTELSADISDTWSIAGKPATIVAREYRLLINGAVVFGPQPSPTIVLPAGTGGRTYSFQLRVEIAEAGGMLSSWVTLKSGTILYAAPQGTAALPDVSLSVGDPARIIDLAPYFSGTDLVYSVQSGALPASSTLIGSVLTIAATEAFGPDTILIRAFNPGGTADQGLQIGITSSVTVPSVFQPGDWSVTAVPSAGAIDIAISALPSDGGSPLTGIEYRLDGGSFVAVGGSGTGTYRITGLGLGQTRLVDLRAVNGSGAGPAGDAKSVTTADVPAAFTPGQWSVSDLGTGSDIRIRIDALPATGGASLDRLQHNIDNAGWVDFPAAPATRNFDILGVVAVGVQSDIAIRAGNAIGDAAQSDVKSITTTLGFDLTATVDGELEIDGATGEITITISSPAEYADYDAGNGPGVFLANTADLVTGPVNLVPPRIIDDGSPDVGDTLTGVPGLWVYDGSDTAPAITRQWESGGVDVSGATAISYSLAAPDAGQRITLKETAAGTNGTRSATSAGVDVAAGMTNVAAHLGEQHVFDTPTAEPRTSIDVSGLAAGEKLILVYNGALDPTQGVFNGNTVATYAVNWSFGSERRGAAYEYTLQAADISAGTIDVGVDIGAPRTLHSMDVIHTASGSVADHETINTNTLTASVTPTRTDNTIFHFLGGRVDRFGGTGMAYSAGPGSRLYNEVGNSTGASAGIVQNGSVAVNTFTWSFDSGTGNYAGILMVIE